jgi:hypothetical protein
MPIVETVETEHLTQQQRDTQEHLVRLINGELTQYIVEGYVFTTPEEAEGSLEEVLCLECVRGAGDAFGDIASEFIDSALVELELNAFPDRVLECVLTLFYICSEAKADIAVRCTLFVPTDDVLYMAIETVDEDTETACILFKIEKVKVRVLH